MDPNHVPALALLAAAARERGDVKAARSLWTRVLTEASVQSDVAGQARENLRLLGVSR